MAKGDILPSGTFPTSTAVTAVGFTPDSKILVGAVERQIRLWDAETGDETKPLTGFRSTVTALAFSPDSKHIAAGSQWQDGIIRIWDVAKSEPKLLLEQGVPITALSYSRDGKLIASAGPDTLIRIWDTSTGSLVRTLKGLQFPASALSWFPSGKLQSIGGPRLPDPMSVTGNRGGAFAGNDKAPQSEYAVWNAGSSDLSFKMLLPNGSLCASFSPDGSRLAMASSHAFKRPVLTAEEEAVVKRGGVVEKEAVPGPGGYPIACWKVGEQETEVEMLPEMPPSQTPINTLGLGSLSWSYDNRLVVAGTVNYPSVWRIVPGEEPFFSDPTPVTTTTNNVFAKQLAKSTERRRREPLINGAGCVAFSPDGKFVIAGDANPESPDRHGIQIWGIVQ